MAPFVETFAPEQVPELQQLLLRALNTWEPSRRPAWVLAWSDRVDEYVAQMNTTHGHSAV